VFSFINPIILETHKRISCPIKGMGFVKRFVPNFSGEDEFWLDFDAVRRDLFSILKKEFTDFPYHLRGKAMVKALDDVSD